MLYQFGGFASGEDTVMLSFSPVADQPAPPGEGEDPAVYNPYQFNISDISYGTQEGDLPEPGTWVLLTSGLFLTWIGSRRLAKTRV